MTSLASIPGHGDPPPPSASARDEALDHPQRRVVPLQPLPRQEPPARLRQGLALARRPRPPPLPRRPRRARGHLLGNLLPQ